MRQVSQLEYAEIVDTEEELFEMISKKLSINEDLEDVMATIVMVSK